MSLVDQLKATYGNVQKLSNGGYYAYNRRGDRLYIPPNYSGNVSLLSYLPGTGGEDPDANVLKKRITSGDPPPYAIAISADCKDKNNTLERAYSVLTSSGINVNQAATVSFSASGGVGFERMNAFLKRHPNVSGVMLCNNAYGMNSYVRYKDTSGLRANQTPIILIDPKGRDETINANKSMAAAGLNGYWMQIGYNKHPEINRDMLANKMVDYVLGFTSDFGRNRTAGGSCGYNLIKYDPKTKQFVQANFSDMVNGNVTVGGINSFRAADGFKVGEESRATTGNKVLSYLTDLSLKSESGTVKTCYAQANDAMNNIRGVIKSTNFLANSSNLTLRSSSGIPGCINEYLNTYYDLVNELLTSLAFQTESIQSYVQAYVDMDNDLNGDVSKIKETAFESTTPQTSYDPSKEEQENKPKNTDVGNENYGGYSNSGGYSSSSSDKIKELWFSYDDGHKGIITYDGNTIASVKYSFPCESASQAANELKSVQELFASDEEIEKVVAEDIYISAYIKKELFANMSVEQIKERFFKEVTKDGETVFR